MPMTTGSFSRRGAIDLSALASQPPAAGPEGGRAGSGAYSVDVTEADFQQVVEQSMNYPVVLSFWSAKSTPSVQINQTLETLAGEFAGQFLLAKVDVDAQPQLVASVGVPSVPLVALVLRGQLAPLLQEPVPIEELRGVFSQVLQTAVANGVTGRVAPRTEPEPEAVPAEPIGHPHLAAAEDAMQRGDLDGAVAAYEAVLSQNPSDPEAVAGLASARLAIRAGDVDAKETLGRATDHPDDVAAQTLAADVELLAGDVEGAFDRMIDCIRRFADDDQDRARTHLLELFTAVGNDDPRVRAARQRLASALF
jgi:putative thioredoxin